MQCWIRLYDLPQECWRPKILFEITNGIGTPITLDEATRTRSLGHFARILVEIDMNKRIPNEIMVERDDYAFFVGTDYEKFPAFCDYCQMIGHELTNCNRKKGDHLQPSRENQV